MICEIFHHRVLTGPIGIRHELLFMRMRKLQWVVRRLSIVRNQSNTEFLVYLTFYKPDLGFFKFSFPLELCSMTTYALLIFKMTSLWVNSMLCFSPGFLSKLERGTLTGKIGNIQLTYISPVSLKTFEMAGTNWYGRLRKRWIWYFCYRNCIFIHLSVSNLLY